MTEVPVKTRKKLIEVALPLDAINAASAREKSIRHGHPSTLHLWWARRPLAAARAVIFAQMVDDPSSYVDTLLSEPETRRAAERELKKRRELWTKRKAEFEAATGKEEVEVPEPGPEPTLEDCAADVERQRLFRIIEELVKWENTTNEAVLQPARDEIWASWRRACLDNIDHPRAKELFDRHNLPAFHDPFAGGGTLPLEAQRLGLEAYASDLNPVAVLINKAMIEIPPKFAGRPPVNPEARSSKELLERQWKGAEGLAEDVRYYGKWMRDEAEKRIGHLYPKVEITAEMAKDRPDLKPLIGQKLTVIAWLWARTVKSPNPAFRDADVPLAANFMLSSKKGKEAFVEPLVRDGGYEFAVGLGLPPADAKNGTKSSRGNFRCILSGAPITPSYIKTESQAGRLGSRLMAIVVDSPHGRVYLPPTLQMARIAASESPRWRPDTEFFQQALGFRVGNYGMTKWSDLYTERQLVALTAFSDLVSEARDRVERDAERATVPGAAEYADALAVYLGLTSSKAARFTTTLSTWRPDEAKLSRSFARNDLPMTWDFAETNPLSGTGGDFEGLAEGTASVLDNLPAQPRGSATTSDAKSAKTTARTVLSTDPPYFDNIGYADLSDYFYVWLRSSLKSRLPELFATVTVPKQDELVATPARHGGKEGAEKFFLDGMTEAMGKLAISSHPGFPITIYYAFKQAEDEDDGGTASTGWETFLAAVLGSGLSVSGTWPVRTEGKTRMRSMKSNALASSILLVCRPQGPARNAATRRDFLTSLKDALPLALAQLQRSNIAPVDLAQAAIGPGMAVFTRYSKVIDADGRELRVRDALAVINEALDEVLAKQEGDFDVDSRWAITWFEEVGFVEGEYGKAEQLSKSRNTSIDGLVRAGILQSGRGKVRLLKPAELDPAWDPSTDPRLTVWEMTHHLIRVLDQGENAAAILLARIGAKVEIARELAYRLYSICERKKRAAEALSYNGLVQAWPEISRLARGLAAAAAAPASPAEPELGF